MRFRPQNNEKYTILSISAILSGQLVDNHSPNIDLPLLIPPLLSSNCYAQPSYHWANAEAEVGGMWRWIADPCTDIDGEFS